eukprot:Blabericola_migrator_1__5412@NODE_2770_length_2372_cov_65_206074_g1734_i0_p5_GENE_NODE_2770_length_2372_cov_65_206074_g1734_i0NODE_2770_length_2372_cov_65_206074_g1734_i0_p5_ORF_typecomplete_len109_score12_17_NODE_2770_length_2372_cov_65_206074_g1734_i08541180
MNCRVSESALTHPITSVARFSTTSYKTMIATVLGEGSYARFQQGLEQVSSQVPHCDSGSSSAVASTSSGVAYPGGPFRLNFNFNLAQWLTQQLMLNKGPDLHQNPFLR